jgi:copper chaperone CopZ
MKIKHLILMVGIMINYSYGLLAQDDKFNEISIKTSSQCEMCKARIEEALAFVKGVKTSNLDLESKMVKVTYNPDKTNPGIIREAISKAGYDADDISADPKAYEKLPACCKKPDTKQ